MVIPIFFHISQSGRRKLSHGWMTLLSGQHWPGLFLAVNLLAESAVYLTPRWPCPQYAFGHVLTLQWVQGREVSNGSTALPAIQSAILLCLQSSIREAACLVMAGGPATVTTDLHQSCRPRLWTSAGSDVLPKPLSLSWGELAAAEKETTVSPRLVFTFRQIW